MANTALAADPSSAMADYYYSAEKAVSDAGYASEKEWQLMLLDREMTATDFLREGAWVILCSGFRESYVRKIFGYVSLCFFDWENASSISQNSTICESTARYAINNPRKLQAITAMSNYIDDNGFEYVENRLKNGAIPFLQEFPMIGPVTSFHLAKNLGIDVSKPDRHLKRIAASWGFDCAQEFCNQIASTTGDRVAVIDITLWRYGALGLS